MPDKSKLIERIDAVLPQTQCGQCKFDGCRPYAVAIAEGHADIDQCPPGGDAGAAAIAAILNIAPKPLNTAYGHPKPLAVAIIDEAQCIGCTFCLRACPVDAIIGAAKCMHTVLTELCTGCERCIAPCPVDCISMVPMSEPATPEIRQQIADSARERYHLRQLRLARNRQKSRKPKQNRLRANTISATQPATDMKKAAIQAAMERARAALARSNIPFKE
ncbi:electron transport complex protein RnfB [Nitrosomonas eutropha]|uniref:RnfABCDGE type electron transport complex subunit B n=1 Tax=Nitrosomonas TaxID=914 RepID=UPI0008964FC5|nr:MULTISPECIES: RnfABCDGE type electron transport complex subunit B [Nitrosomonas]MXS79803.1 RnfABCDGE type electron transport complex subunit B [Nitrosomonas sp. GH22]SDW47530.1 electron transport complex protein RnfB [Nitrosomonas eutropha]